MSPLSAHTSPLTPSETTISLCSCGVFYPTCEAKLECNAALVKLMQVDPFSGFVCQECRCFIRCKILSRVPLVSANSTKNAADGLARFLM